MSKNVPPPKLIAKAILPDLVEIVEMTRIDMIADGDETRIISRGLIFDTIKPKYPNITNRAFSAGITFGMNGLEGVEKYGTTYRTPAYIIKIPANSLKSNLCAPESKIAVLEQKG